MLRRLLAPIATTLAAAAIAGVTATPAAASPTLRLPHPAGTTAVLSQAEADAGRPEGPTLGGDVVRLTALYDQHLQRTERAAAAAALEARTLAMVDGLRLLLPGTAPLVVGFHEARAEHLPLAPTGAHVVMPSRGREGTPTSAVDVVLAPGADVLAPVDGVVVKVAPYRLYDEHDDVLVEIRPTARPDLVVTLYHLQGVTVREGQRVEAGTTVVADGAREFDFIAQVEQWARGPHVDLRVHRA